MTITVNGENTTLHAGDSIRELVVLLGLPDRGIAVAVDGAVVPKGRWDQVLAEGAAVEVVTAVQGG